jgi:hypothetical protein
VQTEKPAFREWAIVEVMGHLKLAGLVSEANMFGTVMCRVDVYPGADAAEPTLTRFFGGASLYGVTPVAEAVARAFASQTAPPPVARYELPQLEAARSRRIRTCPDCGANLYEEDDCPLCAVCARAADPGDGEEE